MRKRLLSLALALAMCLGLAVPAMAAYELKSDKCTYELSSAPIGTTELQGSEWSDETADYVPVTYTVYIIPDNTIVTCKSAPDGKVVSGMSAYGYYLESSEWVSEIWDGEAFTIPPLLDTYKWTEEGEIPTQEAMIYRLFAQTPDEYGSLGPIDSGICIMSATSATTAGIATGTTPTTPVAPAASATATPTSSPVLVNGVQIAFDAYNINDNNYFKLRDLAYVLNGTGKQFEVSWSETENAIALTSGQSYTAVGGEMTSKGEGSKSAVPTTSKIFLDGTEISLTAYNIGDNNYFKLRDIGAAFDFGVDWDAAAGIIRIDTSKGYTPD